MKIKEYKITFVDPYGGPHWSIYRAYSENDVIKKFLTDIRFQCKEIKKPKVRRRL